MKRRNFFTSLFGAAVGLFSFPFVGKGESKDDASIEHIFDNGIYPLTTISTGDELADTLKPVVFWERGMELRSSSDIWRSCRCANIYSIVCRLRHYVPMSPGEAEQVEQFLIRSVLHQRLSTIGVVVVVDKPTCAILPHGRFWLPLPSNLLQGDRWILFGFSFSYKVMGLQDHRNHGDD